jgi:hypothetical protein
MATLARFISFNLGKHSKQATAFAADLLAVALGLRSCYLIDSVCLSQEKLTGLLASLAKHTAVFSHLRVLLLNGDTWFVINSALFLERLRRDINSLFCAYQFVDVSHGLLSPIALGSDALAVDQKDNSKPSTPHQLLVTLLSSCAETLQAVLAPDSHLTKRSASPVFAASATHFGLSLRVKNHFAALQSTLAGWFLEYPVVYCFGTLLQSAYDRLPSGWGEETLHRETANEFWQPVQGNCLSMCPLRVIAVDVELNVNCCLDKLSLFFSNSNPSSNPFATESSVRSLFEHRLFSFSIPSQVFASSPSLQTIVASLQRSLEARISQWRHHRLAGRLRVCCSEITLPQVAL